MSAYKSNKGSTIGGLQWLVIKCRAVQHKSFTLEGVVEMVNFTLRLSSTAVISMWVLMSSSRKKFVKNHLFFTNILYCFFLQRIIATLSTQRLNFVARRRRRRTAHSVVVMLVGKLLSWYESGHLNELGIAHFQRNWPLREGTSLSSKLLGKGDAAH
jgi:hypothetical protein